MAEHKIASDKINQNEQEKAYMELSAEKAKEVMDITEDYILLDVREQDEFEEGHMAFSFLS